MSRSTSSRLWSMVGASSPALLAVSHACECVNRIKNEMREIRTIRTIRTINTVKTIKTIMTPLALSHV